MKKKIFLSGVNAKLALAAVALTSVMFTSCEKEEFNVAPVELDPASATVAITVSSNPQLSSSASFLRLNVLSSLN